MSIGFCTDLGKSKTTIPQCFFLSAVVVIKESKLKAARMHIYVRRGGPNYQTGLAKMRTLGAELGVPIEVLDPLPLSLSLSNLMKRTFFRFLLIFFLGWSSYFETSAPEN
jgi:ATP citrate lyase citrate-binding